MKKLNLFLIIILLFGLTSWMIKQEVSLSPENQLSNKTIRGELYGYGKTYPSISRVSDSKNIVHASAPVLTQYTNHAPISIDGNADFLTQADVENWPGDGTPSNPIVIDELNITGPPESVLIKINNTDLYFQISNCVLSEGILGIDLDYVSNGLIENTIISNNSDIGITLWVSHNITILGNSIFANDRDGILVYFSDDNIVQNNSIYNNTNDGVRSLNSDFLVIKSNIIHNNSDSLLGQGGILLRGGQDSTVTGNAIFYNGVYGIWLDNTNTARILINSIYNNSVQGIRIHSSNNADILGNNLSNNRIGIMVYNSDNTFINSNTINNSVEHGIYLESSSNNLMTQNNLKGNNPNGFFLGDFQAYDSASDNVFEDNYWDDWTSPDANDDGIVDNPYPIDGSANNHDLFPHAVPNPPFHFITSPIVLSPNDGERYSGDITIQWTGSIDSLGHSVTYTIEYSPDYGTTWITLESGFVTTSYNWDSTTLDNGSNYLVKINASCNEGLWEADTSDKKFTIENPPITTTTTTKTVILKWNILLLLLSSAVLLKCRQLRK